MRQNLVLILKLYLEHGIGQRLKDSCHYLNRVFLRQSVSRFRLPQAGFASKPYCVKTTELNLLR
jgi:hypothetical protein